MNIYLIKAFLIIGRGGVRERERKELARLMAITGKCHVSIGVSWNYQIKERALYKRHSGQMSYQTCV